jgi:hypothetical protein
MKKKSLLTFSLLFIICFVSNAQDLITYKNGKTQKVIVLTTNQETITCQDFETKEQFSISKSFISDVKYQEGKSEPFGVILTKPVKTQQNVENNNPKVLFSHPYSKNPLTYKGFHEIGYIAALTDGFSSRISVTSSNGIVIDNSVYLGLIVGAGFATKKYGEGAGYLLGLDPKISLSNYQENPNVWLGCKAGVVLNDGSNLFFHPHFIIEPKSAKSNGNFIFTIGYLIQQGDVFNWTGWSGKFDKTYSNNVTLSVGLSF